MRTRRSIVPVLISLVILLTTAGCGTNPSLSLGPEAGGDTGLAAGETWTFTDDRGITVTLPRRPVRIVAQSSAAAALWDLGIQVVGVFGPQRLPDGSSVPEIGRVDLSTVTSVGEQWGEIDLEKLAALRPDIILTTMYLPPELWYVPAELEPKVQAIAPIVAIDVGQKPIVEPIRRFEALAEALGADLSTPAHAAARQRFENASADLKAAIAEKPGLEAMFAAGSLETFWVSNPPSFADLLQGTGTGHRGAGEAGRLL